MRTLRREDCQRGMGDSGDKIGAKAGQTTPEEIKVEAKTGHTTPEKNHNEIDLESLEEWEKTAILKVLQRNNDVQKMEERRITQLCVRLQLNHMSDSEFSDMRRIIETKSGSWIRALSEREVSDPTPELRRFLLSTMKQKNGDVYHRSPRHKEKV